MQINHMSRAVASLKVWEDDPRWGREHWGIRHEAIQWPQNARVAAVCGVSFNFPDMNFDYLPPAYTGSTIKYSSILLYGGRRGVWRLLDLLDRHNYKASFEVNGIAAEQFPEAVKEISKRGHEIVAGHWADNVRHDKQTPEEERNFVKRTLSAIENVTGKRPSGWVAPQLAIGAKTLNILAEEGIKWHANSIASDLPYVIHVDGKPMVVLPHAFHNLNDEFYVFRGLPKVYLEFMQREFAALHREGAKAPKMFNFSVHAHIGGRAFFFSAIEEMLSQLSRFSDVWLTTRQQVVDWWEKQKYT